MAIFHLSDFRREDFSIALNRQEWRAGYVEPPHRHDFVEIVYVLSGCGVNRIDRIAFPILCGDVYVIGRGRGHAFSSGGDLVFYNLMFRLSVFSRMELKQFRAYKCFASLFETCDSENPGKIRISPRETVGFEPLFQQLDAELATRAAGGRLEAKAILTRIINAICRKYTGVVSPGVPPERIDADDPLPRLVEFLELNFQRPLSLDDLAEHANLSGSYVGEFFRRRTGVTPGRYLNLLRLNCALRLLRCDPRLRISEVARKSGFPDQSYFARKFREILGSSPRECRDFAGRLPEPEQ